MLNNSAHYSKRAVSHPAHLYSFRVIEKVKTCKKKKKEPIWNRLREKLEKSQQIKVIALTEPNFIFILISFPGKVTQFRKTSWARE